MNLTRKISFGPNLKNIRTNIHKAIEAGDWPLVLRLRRKQVQMSPSSSSAWLQYGHALKECGFYDMADEAYLKALKLAPGSKEITFQRGHLQKLCGNMGPAFELYSSARDGWPGDAVHVQAAIDNLKRLANTINARGIFPSRDEIDCAIYISSVCKMFEESDCADMSRRIGRADYSYAFALKGFSVALDELGIDYHILDEVSGVADVRNISTAKKVIHIGFYPPEKINLLKGAYNIICFAWEFERLRLETENLSYHAFSDQAFMLGLADEVWVPSQHGVENVKKSLSNVVTYMPSPAVMDRSVRDRPKVKTKRFITKAAALLKDISWVPLSVMPRLQNALSHNAQSQSTSLQKVIFNEIGEHGDPVVYISIFNAHDYRKNVDSLIRAFDAFSRENPNAYLFLKLADDQKPAHGPNASILHGQMSSPDRLVASINSRNIWLTWDAFTREQLNALFDISRFYVCTSIAEGQNLPLIEAMARKTVPVSVQHTAMNDYIREENSVIIAHRKAPAPNGFADRYKMFGITLDIASAEDVYDALIRSTSIREDDYERMATASFDTISDVFGPVRIADRLSQLLS